MTLTEYIASQSDLAALAVEARDQEIDALLRVRDQRGPIPCDEINRWSALNGLMVRLHLVAIDPQHPAFAAAYTAERWLSDVRNETLDIDLIACQSMLAGLVAANMMSDGERTELEALAANRSTRAVAALGFQPTLEQIGAAR